MHMREYIIIYTLDFEEFMILTSSKFRQLYVSKNNTQLLPTEFMIFLGQQPPAY